MSSKTQKTEQVRAPLSFVMLFVHHARSRATLRLQRPNTRLRDSQGHRGIERTMRTRVAHGLRRSDPGRACGQGPAPIAHHCYCTRFAASAGAIRLSARTSGQRDGAGGGDGAERGTVGTDGTDGTDGADGAGGTTNCRRCADGLRRGLGSFTMGKPALRPSPAAGACHVGSVPKGSFFLSIRKNMGQESRSLPAASRV